VNVVGSVRETQSPDGNQWFAPVKKIRLVCSLRSYFQIIHQLFPILDNGRTVFARVPKPGEIIHNRYRPAILLRRFERVLKDHAAFGPPLSGPKRTEEPLNEHAVNSVLLHPPKVNVRGALVPRTEDVRWSSIPVSQRR